MVVSNIGTWMQRVAQDWLVLQLTAGSAAALGITTGLQFLPMLLTPLGGLLADRVSKIKILRATQVALAVLALVQGALTLSGAVQVWHVYLLAFLLGVVNAVDTPSRQSLAAELVPIEDLPNAVSLNSASFQSARIVGPGVAGLLITLVGTGWVFVLNAFTFLGPLLALVRIRDAAPPRSKAKDGGGLRAGLAYVRSRPDLQLVMGVVFFVGTFGLNFQMTMALMATEVYGKGAREFGLLGSIMAVGSLTGALLAARRGRVGYRFVVAAALLFGGVEILAGLMPSYHTFAIALVVVGLTALTLMTAANSYVQASADPGMRGRVMSIYLLVFMGGSPVGAPLIGWVAEHLGARWSIAGGGLITALGTIAVTALFAARSGLELRPQRWRLRTAHRLAETELEEAAQPA